MIAQQARSVVRAGIVAVSMMGATLLTFPADRALADHPGPSPRDFIESLAHEAVTALTASEISRPERIRHFRGLLADNFDVPLIGRWVLGRYWAAATDREKEEYIALFEDLIVATYVDRFDQYSGESLSVTRTVMEPGKDAVVFTEIVRPSGSGAPVRVDWRVHHGEDEYRIVDVYIEGMSMGQTQRSEFASVIRRNGGSIEGLLKVLREKVAGLR